MDRNGPVLFQMLHLTCDAGEFCGHKEILQAGSMQLSDSGEFSLSSHLHMEAFPFSTLGALRCKGHP